MVYKTIIYTALLLILASCNTPDPGLPVKKNKKGGIYEAATNGLVLSHYKKQESATLDTTSYISFDDFDKVWKAKEEDRLDPVLQFRLNENGSNKLKILTERNVNKQIYFVVEDIIMCAPVLQTVISNGEIELNMLDDDEGMDMIVGYLTK